MKHNRVFFLSAVAAVSFAASGAASAGVLLDMEREMGELVEEVTPSVVQVISEKGPFPLAPLGPGMDTLWPGAKGWPVFTRGGSGFLIDGKGHILTTANVIEGAERIRVVLRNGAEMEAELKGLDRQANIAMLKVDGDGLRGLPLGDSDTLRPGTPVITVGNPFGFMMSVTWGVVAGVGRKGLGTSEIENLIQIDTSINPGDSGGPVVDMKGRAVGIMSASMGGAWTLGPRGEGIAFAIPINMVKELIPRLEKGEVIEHGWLGVGVQRLTAALGKQLGAPDLEGVLVAMVVPGSPAERAGVREGDIIRAIDGRPVCGPSELLSIVSKKRIGQEVGLSILRGGEKKELKVVVGSRKKTESAAAGRREALPLGLSLKAYSPPGASEKERGLAIVGVRRGSPAAKAGLRRGDVIYEVNRKRVTTPSDWERAAKSVSPGKAFLVRTGRGFFVIKAR